MTKLFDFPSGVEVVEVGPRDGLQNEATPLDLSSKVWLANTLSRCGFQKIEIGSFVHPRLVPQMADTDLLVEAMDRHPAVKYVGLVANAKGVERAIRAGVDEVNFVLAASETFNQRNVRKSVSQCVVELSDIISLCKPEGVTVWCSIATSFGCPFEGVVPQERALSLAESTLALGVAGITFADTTGMANPLQVGSLVGKFRSYVGEIPLTLHFHNTRGLGLANVLAGLQVGCRSFDASIGGLGGCPFAPGATGNVCTEDVVHMFEEMGIETGVDLDALMAAARNLERLVGHPLPGQVIKAGKRSQTHGGYPAGGGDR